MLNFKKLGKLFVIIFVGASLSLAMSCTKHPNEQQIRKMEETRAAALSAEQKLEELKQQRRGLEDQLSAKKKELQTVKDDKAATQDRVANWNQN